jgi:putative hemolysin
MKKPFLSYASPQDPRPKRMAISLLEVMFGRPKVMNIYLKWRSEVDGTSPRAFGKLMEMYDIELSLKGHWPLPKIPDGPIVMVSNHPFGIGDGMALGAIAEQFGRPYKVLINERLARLPELRPYILPISFDDTREAVEMNIATRHAAVRLLKDGGTVGIFPAGGVATAPLGYGLAEELPWKMFLTKLVQASAANVLPIHVDGQNSLLFQAVSRVSLTARRALLCREFVKQLGDPIVVQVGALMPWDELSSIRDRKALLDHIQTAVLSMRPDDPRRNQPRALGAKSRHPLWQEDAVVMTNNLKRFREKPQDGDAAGRMLPGPLSH